MEWMFFGFFVSKTNIDEVTNGIISRIDDAEYCKAGH